VAIGVLAVFILITWFLGVTVDNMGPGGNAGYFILAGMALIGVGWWFWGRLKDLK
jgi:hypothetical protein